MKRPVIQLHPAAAESQGRAQRTARVYDYQQGVQAASLTLQVSRLDDGRLIVDLFCIDGPVEVRLPAQTPEPQRCSDYVFRYNQMKEQE